MSDALPTVGSYVQFTAPARVSLVEGGRGVVPKVVLACGIARITIVGIGNGMKFEANAPDQWPPQAGDVWTDKNGQIWFFYNSHDSSQLVARTPTGAFLDGDPAGYLLAEYSPLALRDRFGLSVADQQERPRLLTHVRPSGDDEILSNPTDPGSPR